MSSARRSGLTTNGCTVSWVALGITIVAGLATALGAHCTSVLFLRCGRGAGRCGEHHDQAGELVGHCGVSRLRGPLVLLLAVCRSRGVGRRRPRPDQDGVLHDRGARTWRVHGSGLIDSFPRPAVGRIQVVGAPVADLATAAEVVPGEGAGPDFQGFRERDDAASIAAAGNRQLSCLHLGFYLGVGGILRGSTDLLKCREERQTPRPARRGDRRLATGDVEHRWHLVRRGRVDNAP